MKIQTLHNDIDILHLLALSITNLYLVDTRRFALRFFDLKRDLILANDDFDVLERQRFAVLHQFRFHLTLLGAIDCGDRKRKFSNLHSNIFTSYLKFYCKI